MRVFILIILAIATVWDIFTTVYGTIQILGNSFLQIVIAILFSALVFGFNLGTKRIMQWRERFVSGLAKFVWFVAIGFDFFTSWITNAALVIPGERNLAETFMLFGLSLLVTVSPLLLYAMRSPRLFQPAQIVEQPVEPVA